LKLFLPIQLGAELLHFAKTKQKLSGGHASDCQLGKNNQHALSAQIFCYLELTGKDLACPPTGPLNILKRFKCVVQSPTN
jgi:hypothetical protein